MFDCDCKPPDLLSAPAEEIVYDAENIVASRSRSAVNSVELKGTHGAVDTDEVGDAEAVCSVYEHMQMFG